MLIILNGVLSQHLIIMLPNYSKSLSLKHHPLIRLSD